MKRFRHRARMRPERAIVRRLLDQETQPVIIQADKDVPTGTTMRVYDQAKLGGADKISIATVKP